MRTAEQDLADAQARAANAHAALAPGEQPQIAQAQADLMVEHERMKAKIYNTLTPEQRARMEELHRRGGPHDGRPGPPNGPPPPPPPPGN